MKKIELRKRSKEEQDAYFDGLRAGYLQGMGPKVMVLRLNMFIKSSDIDEEAERINAILHEGGVLILPSYYDFCGLVPQDAELHIEGDIALVKEENQ